MYLLNTRCLLFVLLLASCSTIPSFPGTPDTAPQTKEGIPLPANPTGGTGEGSGDTGCFFNWARQPLPAISTQFRQALRKIDERAEGYAEAYGEDCLDKQGQVQYFVAMESDFYITFNLESLDDRDLLGAYLGQVITLISESYPPERTPGPQPGTIRVTFESSGESVNLWFTLPEAQKALDESQDGETLFESLHKD